MSISKDIGLSILAALFPPACLACGRVEGKRSLPLCLCGHCRSLLRSVESLDCARCGLNLTSAGLSGVFHCQRCQKENDAIASQLTLWRYEFPLDSIIHGLKFKRMEFLGPQLATALHHKHSDVLSEINVVVPIPLYWYRRLGRGYNQAEAIGLPLSRMLEIPLVRALWRKRPTRAQARLDRGQRLQNLESALAPTSLGVQTLRNSRILLVDDVMTTGATLSAAAHCLALCGVQSVTTITVGSTASEQRRKGASVYNC